ncbi:MAG: branched-chain amino acid ABC transporter permease [Planctomycetota bacterium]|jgi:branched-chain amino acid transport system permease protein
MESTSEELSTNSKLKLRRVREFVAPIPLLSWLLGILVAVALEYLVGTSFARTMGLRKAPMLFGFVIMLKQPMLIHSALIYLVLIYFLPIIVVARLSAASMNSLAAKLLDYHLMLAVFIHLGMLYAILHWWSDMSLYRADVLRFTLIAVLLTLSLNLINGYMGEFSCSHPGFMALGAYASSVFTVGLFADDRVFGAALLPHWLGPFLFPIALILGGLVAAIGALAVAIPSFRTRGDYLAIISLAFMFIVKSLIENLEFVGGARGLGDQPGWANRPVVFVTVVLGIWIINNFVRSTLGKALNAVRDNEMAADAMTVNTRQTKITAFLFAAFWAGVAGGLYAHALRYVNPGSFGIQRLAEVLAMVYFGGLNSVYGSIVGACSISLLGEILRPLELFKWIIIPLLLILVMIFRPTGLIAFKEFDVKRLVRPKQT